MSEFLGGKSGAWVALESAPALFLVLIVWPVSWLWTDPITIKSFLVTGALTLASSDLVAAGFCFLLPALAHAMKGNSSDSAKNKMMLRITLSILLTSAFYWMFKAKPLVLAMDKAIETQVVARAILYSIVSVVVCVIAVSTAYAAKIEEQGP